MPISPEDMRDPKPSTLRVSEFIEFLDAELDKRVLPPDGILSFSINLHVDFESKTPAWFFQRPLAVLKAAEEAYLSVGWDTVTFHLVSSRGMGDPRAMGDFVNRLDAVFLHKDPLRAIEDLVHRRSR